MDMKAKQNERRSKMDRKAKPHEGHNSYSSSSSASASASPRRAPKNIGVGGGYTPCIVTETIVAREEFIRVTDEEQKRIKQVTALENERIMEVMRSDGTIQICPICLDELPPITPYEENEKGFLILCCNAVHCINCATKSKEFIYGTDKGQCYNCREPLRTPRYWAKSIKHDDKRHWILSKVGSFYMSGMEKGLKKNVNRAIRLYKRAAELGNAEASETLAQIYDRGDLGPPKNKQQARYYAEKGAHLGRPYAQDILSFMILDDPAPKDDPDHEERQVHLLTCAAYQGSAHGRIHLARIYQRRYNRIKDQFHADWKKNVQLALYWFGKAAESELEIPKLGALKANFALSRVASNLDVASTFIWHPRSRSIRDPLTGFSHIPFCTWALGRGGHYSTEVARYFTHSWNDICANCLLPHQEEQEPLKACARCKAFHYCSKNCQVEHWKAGHKNDCKGHWIEEFFPEIRKKPK
jgi:hypothetical protein